MTIHQNKSRSFNFDYTLWTTKKIHGNTLKKYKSILKSIDPGNYDLFRNMRRLRDSDNTLHGSLVYEGRWEEWYEWIAIRILLKMTELDKSLVVHIQDDFGCPLALELCDMLNLENQPDKRVFLHKGRIHAVPTVVKLNTLKTIYSTSYNKHFSGTEAAANFIRDSNLNKEVYEQIKREQRRSDQAGRNSNDIASGSILPHNSKFIDLNKIPTIPTGKKPNLDRLPDVPTSVDFVVQKHVFDILDGLDDLEQWSKSFTERQSQRLMAMGSNAHIPKSASLVLSDLMKVSIDEFDISPISSNVSSPGSSKKHTSLTASSTDDLYDDDDNEDLDDNIHAALERPGCSHNN